MTSSIMEAFVSLVFCLLTMLANLIQISSAQAKLVKPCRWSMQKQIGANLSVSCRDN